MNAAPPGATGALPLNCHVCHTPLPAGTDRCPRCGAVHGSWRRCEGCGALADVIRKGDAVYVCAACGRPRVPLEQPVQRSGVEREPLARESDARTQQITSNVLGIIGVGSGGFAMLAALALTLLSATGLATVAGVVGIVGFVLAALMFRRASVARHASEEAARDALGAIALDVMREKGPVTAAQLAAILGVPQNVAEAALARLPARTDVRVDTVVDEAAIDGQIRYRVSEDHAVPPTLVSAADAEQADFDRRLAESIQAKKRTP